jgi:hypothetical protein
VQKILEPSVNRTKIAFFGDSSDEDYISWDVADDLW